ncbi:MAG: hypothetical protein NZM25_05180 [Leptospiraceae bacterium]|nr:hypothetical protein [Leptospiraceae bacterium]
MEEKREDTPSPPKKSLGRRLFLGFLISLLLVIAGLYFYVTSPAFLEKTITNAVAQATNGRISLKVTQASLFRGFVFEDIALFATPEFGEKPLLRLESLKLLYNVYGFWTGEFGVLEVGIYRPQIYLKQLKDQWNIQALLKPSEKKEEKIREKEKEEEKEEVREKITLPFSVRAFFKFVLEDFAIEVDGEDRSNTKPLAMGIKNFTFRLYFLTKKFHTIPAEPIEFSDLIDSLYVNLNPQESIDVYLRSPTARGEFPLDLHFLLAYGEEKGNFISKVKIGHENLPLKYQGRHLLPLGFRIQYDMSYDPEKDFFKINQFQIKVLRQLWLSLEGHIAQLAKPSQTQMDIKLKESDIRLDEFLTYYRTFTSDRKLTFGGKISLAPLTITGKLDDLLVAGMLSLKKVYARLPQLQIQIPFFDLSYEARANLIEKKKIPLKYAKAGYKGELNGARLEASLLYEPQNKVDVGVLVKNLNTAVFTQGALSGIFHLNFNIQGPSENKLSSLLTLESPSFYYMADRAPSGVNRLYAEVQTNISSPTMAFQEIDVSLPKIYLSLQNKEKRHALLFEATSQLRIKPRDIQLFFNLGELRLHLRNLQPTLTEKNREALETLTQVIRQSIVLRGSTTVGIKGNQQKIEHATNLILEDFGISDIWLKAGIGIRPGLIDISTVSLEGIRNTLNMQLTGTLKEGNVESIDPNDPNKIIQKKGMAPDISISFHIERPKAEKIFQEVALAGSFSLKANLRNNIAKGNFAIKDFTVSSPTFAVNQVNLNFPFEHNLLLLKPLNLMAANKERIIKNYNFAEKANFTIQSVEIPHPTQPGKKFQLIYPQGSYPGLSAVMRYDNNVFQMPYMQIYMLNGLISMQDVVFNLGRLNPKEMEYLVQLQIKDLDLKKLIPPDKAKAISDGSIRMDLLFSGSRLDQPIENLTGYVSIYKIGEEFGKQALKVVKPDSGGAVDFVVDNSILVRRMDLDIKEGLVYARVIYQKKIFGQIISPAGDQILQERIPIPEFMQRAGREVQVYQKEKEKTSEA